MAICESKKPLFVIFFKNNKKPPPKRGFFESGYFLKY